MGRREVTPLTAMKRTALSLLYLLCLGFVLQACADESPQVKVCTLTKADYAACEAMVKTFFSEEKKKKNKKNKKKKEKESSDDAGAGDDAGADDDGGASDDGDGGAGEIAFMKETTPLDFAADGNTPEGWSSKSLADLKLVCPDGGCADPADYSRCNYARIPSHMIAVSPDLPVDEIRSEF